jgi:hypothetical protein
MESLTVDLGKSVTMERREIVVVDVARLNVS